MFTITERHALLVFLDTDLSRYFFLLLHPTDNNIKHIRTLGYLHDALLPRYQSQLSLVDDRLLYKISSNAFGRSSSRIHFQLKLSQALLYALSSKLLIFFIKNNLIPFGGVNYVLTARSSSIYWLRDLWAPLFSPLHEYSLATAVIRDAFTAALFIYFSRAVDVSPQRSEAYHYGSFT